MGEEQALMALVEIGQREVSVAKQSKKQKKRKNHTHPAEAEIMKKAEEPQEEIDITALSELSVPLPKKFRSSGVMAFQTMTAAEQMATALNQNNSGIQYMVEVDEAHGLAVVVTNTNTGIKGKIEGIERFRVPREWRKKAIEGVVAPSLYSDEECIAMMKAKEKKLGSPLEAIMRSPKNEDTDKVLYLIAPAKPFLDRNKKPISIGDELYHLQFGRGKVTESGYDSPWVVTPYQGEVYPYLVVDFENGKKQKIFSGKNKEYKHTLWKTSERCGETFKEWLGDNFHVLIFAAFMTLAVATVATMPLRVKTTSVGMTQNATVVESRDICVQVTWYNGDNNSVQLIDENGTAMTFRMPPEYMYSRWDDPIRMANSYVNVTVKSFDDGTALVYYGDEQLDRIG